MDDLDASGLILDAQSRDQRGRRMLRVVCPGCMNERVMGPTLWRRRKSDYCKPCGRRVRAGLAPTADIGRGTRLGNIWAGMRQRCGVIGGAPSGTLANYVERGIRVCDEWAYSFETFRDWALSSGYRDDLLLDREDNNLGYEPGNCRWVTWTISNRNKRSVKLNVERRQKSGADSCRETSQACVSSGENTACRMASSND